MSDNKMQQNLTELACLDLVKKAYWSGTCLFGLENDDKGTLWHLLENCNSNKGTKFPDFIGDQGFKVLNSQILLVIKDLLNIFKFHRLKQQKEDKSTQNN